MKKTTMYLLSSAVYGFFLICLAAVYFCVRHDSDTFALGLYAVTTSMVVCTLILAAIFSKDVASERYAERFSEDSDRNKDD